MTAPVSGDLLSAASLLATIISLLYSIWYGEIKEAQGAEIALQKADRGPAIQRVRATLLYRAVPLLGSAVLLVLILLPSTIDIIRNTWEACFGPGTRQTYDPVEACFVAVYLVIIMLTVVTVFAVYGLAAKLRKLRA
jgi:hypothetical protein